jgi:hypothetical protein
LGAWIENAERLHRDAEGFEHEARVGSREVDEAFLKGAVFRPREVDTFPIPGLSNSLPRYFLVIHYPKLEHNCHIKALQQRISMIKVFRRPDPRQLLVRTDRLHLTRISLWCRTCCRRQAPIPFRIKMHFLPLRTKEQKPLQNNHDWSLAIRIPQATVVIFTETNLLCISKFFYSRHGIDVFHMIIAYIYIVHYVFHLIVIGAHLLC